MRQAVRGYGNSRSGSSTSIRLRRVLLSRSSARGSAVGADVLMAEGPSHPSARGTRLPTLPGKAGRAAVLARSELLRSRHSPAAAAVGWGRSSERTTRPERSSSPRARGRTGAVADCSVAAARRGYGLASRMRLNGVSVARRTRVNPPWLRTSVSRASPACAPKARPTSWASDAGVQITVEAP